MGSLYRLSLLFILLSLCSFPIGAQTIQFAYQTGVNYVTAMVAERMGFFEEYGLHVEGKIFTSGPLVSESIISGAAEIGMMGDTPAIIAVTKNLPVTIIASVAGGSKRNRLMIRTESTIVDLKDLEGKRIGVAYGTSSHGALYSLADKKGFSLDRVEMMNIRPTDMIEAMATHQVDAVIVWEPTPSLIEAEGVGKELITLACIGNEFPTFLMVNNRLLDRNPETVLQFLKALEKANQFIHENWEEAIEIASIVTGLCEKILEKSMSYIYYDLNLNEKTINSFHQTALFLKNYDSISTLPDVDQVIDSRLLEELKEETKSKSP